MTQEITIDELKKLVGQEVGVSPYREVTQSAINQFADVTDDHQYIHVDLEKAKASPFGGTIAHGFLTLSLLPTFAAAGTPTIKGKTMGVNYGFDKLRMMSPVKAGAKVRGRFVLKALEAKADKQYQLVYTVTVEIEGATKPALVGDWVTLTYVS